MKKLLACLLTIILALGACTTAWAEAEAAEPAETVEAAETVEPAEAPEPEIPELTYNYDEATVAATTPLTGQFFTSMWGNGSSDLEVRYMIHGYNLVVWNTETGVFETDPSVISGIDVRQEANGDMTFLITLYDDLYYSDGTPVTAWDYAFSMLLTMAPEMKELGAAVRTPEYIAGYDDYISGKSRGLSGVRVITDRMLNITIDSRYLPFFYELGLLDCIPYPIAVIAPGVKVADDGTGVYLANADGQGGEPVFTADLLRKTLLDEETGYRTHPSVTSGPYMLTSYKDGAAEFTINPRYKGDAKGKKPSIPTIRFISLPSDKLFPALGDGSVTVLTKVSDAKAITDCLRLTTEHELLTSSNYFRSGLSFINFNTTRSPLDNLEVRQAIAYLADRDGVVKETLAEYGLRGRGYYGMGQWMYLVLNGTVLYPVEEPAEDADQKTQQEYEAAMEAWRALSLDVVEAYDPDMEKGAALLDRAGWNLNENGEAYRPGEDRVRYRKTEAGLEPLRLTLAYSEGSTAGPALEGTLAGSLAEAGIDLKVEAIPGEELFAQYYGQAESRYDMLFLATNFDVLYDPSLSFIQTEDGHHVWKASGLEDDELWRLSVEMRKTEPGNQLEYCRRWLEFQKRFMEQLPLLPVYSNVYFDFFPHVLHDYQIASNIAWPQAIIESYMADYIPEEQITGPEEAVTEE